MRVCERIAAAASVGGALDETASPQTGEVIRQELTADPELVREVGGIGGGVSEGEQDACPSRVRQCMPEAGDRGGMSERCLLYTSPSPRDS